MEPQSSPPTSLPASAGAGGSAVPAEQRSPIRSNARGGLTGSTSDLGVNCQEQRRGQNNIVASPSMIDKACGQKPFEMLIKGEEQIVHIPLKTILNKVAEELPAKGKPVFECNIVGNSAYQSFVSIDVSGSRCCADPHVKVARIEGQICASKNLAEISAVKKTFEYLEKNRFIYVKDYSRKIASQLEEDSVYLQVNSALYVLDQVLAKWSFAMDTISQFRNKLENKDAMAKLGGTPGENVVIYREAVEFLDSFMSMYTDKHRAAYLKLVELEAERKKYMEQSEEKTNKLLKKVLRATVHFTSKDTLDYVVSKLGLGRVKYSNEVVRGCLYIGKVKLELPSIQDVGCGGRTVFCGVHCSSARRAEEDAAARALRFFEEKLKVTVTDMNYAERVQAKELQRSNEGLLHKIVDLAAKVKSDWSSMSDSVKCGLDIYGDVKEFSCPSLSNDQATATRFCATGMVSAHDSFFAEFKVASVQLQKLEEYRYRDADDDEY